MRRLWPDPADLPLEALYDDLSFPGPATFVGLVGSLDGAATVDGVSGGLGGEGDLHAFRALRACADAVLAGAATVRAEDYRGVRLPEEVRARRRAAGRAEVPPVVVLTGSLDLDPGARLFHDTSRPPWLLVPSGRLAEAEERFGDRAEVVAGGDGDRVDLVAGVQALRARGVERLLCEGGPSLAGAMLARGLVDEVFLTLAPVVVGGGRRVIAGLEAPVPLRLVALHEHAGDLLLRLRVGAAVDVAVDG